MATDRRTGGHVAAKVLHPDHAPDPKEVKRFVQEAQLGAQIRHPNLIPTYDFGGVGGCHYIIMELVDGQSVAQAGRLDPQRSASLVLDLLYAVAALHEHGIVHRDISPSNVLIETVDGRQRARLADLGIARKLTEQDLKLTDVPLTKPTMVCGTSGYIAPECVRGARNDYHADIYSIGAVWHAMLTGVAPPFLREGEPGTWPPLAHKLAMPTPLRAVLLGALDERSKRHHSAASMATALRVAMEAGTRSPRPGVARLAVPSLALILLMQVGGSLRPVTAERPEGEAVGHATPARAAPPDPAPPVAPTPGPTTRADVAPGLASSSRPTLAGPGPMVTRGPIAREGTRPRGKSLRASLAGCKASDAPLEVVFEPGREVEVNGGPPFGDIGRCVTREAAKHPTPARKLTLAL